MTTKESRLKVGDRLVPKRFDDDGRLIEIVEKNGIKTYVVLLDGKYNVKLYCSQEELEWTYYI